MGKIERTGRHQIELNVYYPGNKIESVTTFNMDKGFELATYVEYKDQKISGNIKYENEKATLNLETPYFEPISADASVNLKEKELNAFFKHGSHKLVVNSFFRDNKIKVTVSTPFRHFELLEAFG